MRKTIILILISFLSAFTTRSYAQKTNVIIGSFFKTETAEKLNSEGIRLSINGDIDGGNKKYYEALKIEPENPAVLSNIGLNLNSEKNFKEAEKLYMSALKHSDSTYLMAGANLGILYHETKEFSKGIEILDYVIRNETSPRILYVIRYYRALSLIELGYCNKASRDLDYLESNKNNIENPRLYIKKNIEVSI